MEHRKDIRDFLASRRAKITPEEAQVPVYGGKRRVPGLRREEVALLAGVSVDYYTRLERGNLRGVSDTVLNSVAAVLRLDESERAHLFDLARGSASGGAGRRRAASPLRPALRHVLDALAGAPAWISDERLDVLAANALCAALYQDAFAEQGREPNLARFVFLDPRSRDFFLDWGQHADNAAASLCAATGRHRGDEKLAALVAELRAGSDDFRARWQAHDVRLQLDGAKGLQHPVAGRLDLVYERLQLPSDAGLTLFVLVAEPGSPTADRLKLLGG
ncbi:MAG: helix-turn-helix domain-containing protein [Segniliparus sp.]|uniref:helix-turn-helix domain-containing protein n=1 Tax=Segniliparus sp. TaxID=2804064 RepID=UPI003F2EFB50